jgi:PAS domain S-box-containing protein
VRSPDAPSGSTLRALLVEDSENDALLVAEELRRGGYEPACERVSTPEEMELALTGASARGEPWQVVLSDYYMPHFGAPDALALLRRLGYDTPFIVVSGKIGEDAAVAMMQAGAQDYVIKENLARLCPAIERELREAAVRQERKKAEEALNRSREAQRLLAEAGAVLSSSLDYQVTLESLARLVVPRLADWCAVDVVAEDESTHRLAVEHQNPEKVRLAHELQRRYPPDPGARQGTPQVLRSGRSEFYPEITEEMIEAAARDEEHLRLLREMAFTSLITVPLVARGKILGAITLVSAESGRRFEEADLRVAEELARRAALAMDNAKLYEEAQKEIAERKRAEEELRRSEERYRAVVEQSTEGIYLLDAETKRILEANPALLQMLGYEDEELLGMEVYDLIAHPREDVDSNLGRTLKEGRRFVGERKYRHKDGSLVVVEVGVSVIRYGGRKLVCAVVRDVTERKRTEERMREVREAERNRIARDLHDDILQDLVYALQEIQIMQVTSENGPDAALGDTAEALRRSVEGLRGAIFELRLKEGLGRSFVSALESLVDLNRRMARNRYELQLDVEDGFPPTLSEKASRELTRIIQEALTNARRHSEARRVEVRLWLAGDLACAEVVVDDGRGFDAAQTRIGMGQHSMRHRAFELGDLQVESEPSRGTRVRFYAPLSRLIEA